MPRMHAALLAPLFSVIALSMDTARMPIDSESRIPLTLTLGAQSVVGGNQTTATITVGTAAPQGGTTVTIAYPLGTNVLAGANQVGIIQPVGATNVGIPAGQLQVTVTIGTAGVAQPKTVTFSVTSGTDVASANLTITPASLRTVTISPQSVTGGQSATLTIVLDGAAPSVNGMDIPIFQQLGTVQTGVSLPDGSVQAVKVAPPPAFMASSVHLPPGASSVNATIATTPVAHDQTVYVTAGLGKIPMSAPLTLKAPVVTQLQLAPSAVIAGDTSFATVSLNAPAPPGGLSVPMTTSRAGLAMRASVTVPAGASSSTFPIATSATFVGATIITAGPAGSVLGTGTPSSIPDGTSNTISIGEASSRASATLSVATPVVLRSVSTSAQLTGGDAVQLVLAFGTADGSASVLGTPVVHAGTAAITVDQPALVQLPSSVSVESNTTTAKLNGTTTAASADATVTITATFKGKALSTALTLKAPPPALESFTARPTTAVGGTNIIVSIKLVASATTAHLVTLSTDRPDVIQIPSPFNLSPSAVPTPITLKTQPVTASTTATITAASGAQQISVTVTITPPPP